MCLLTLTLIALLAQAPEIQQTKHITSYPHGSLLETQNTRFLFSLSFILACLVQVCFTFSSSFLDSIPDLCDRHERDIMESHSIRISSRREFSLLCRLNIHSSQFRRHHRSCRTNEAHLSMSTRVEFRGLIRRICTLV